MSSGVIMGNIVKMEVRNVVVDMPSLSANTSEENTFAVPDLRVSDFVIASKSDLDAGIIYGSARVSAANVLAIQCVNATAAPVDPASETIKLMIFRPSSGD